MNCPRGAVAVIKRGCICLDVPHGTSPRPVIFNVRYIANMKDLRSLNPAVAGFR